MAVSSAVINNTPSFSVSVQNRNITGSSGSDVNVTSVLSSKPRLVAKTTEPAASYTRLQEKIIYLISEEASIDGGVF
jgi:hypothetical protein